MTAPRAFVKTSLDAGRWRRTAGAPQVLRSILKAVMPVQNPDFEARYDSVIEWLLEIDESSGRVTREIGLDETGAPIVVAPYRENVGYWTSADEALEWRGMIRVRPQEFETLWGRFHAGR